MARTLSQILIDANAVLDLEASSPTGSDLTVRANYANQAVWDASATGQFTEFKREYITAITTLATIPMPSGFNEAMENPRLNVNGGWIEYPIIEVEQKYQKAAGDYYSYIMGDPAGGYNLILNNPQANTTLSIIYQRFPSGLSTLTDVCELSDPQYVVRKIESYVLYSRSDERFPIAESRAQQSLANMAGREMKGTAPVKMTTQTFNNPLKNLS